MLFLMLLYSLRVVFMLSGWWCCFLICFFYAPRETRSWKLQQENKTRSSFNHHHKFFLFFLNSSSPHFLHHSSIIFTILLLHNSHNNSSIQTKILTDRLHSCDRSPDGFWFSSRKKAIVLQIMIIRMIVLTAPDRSDCKWFRTLNGRSAVSRQSVQERKGRRRNSNEHKKEKDSILIRMMVQFRCWSDPEEDD